jgi:uncharacterized protein YqjF (DUF2071 family)
LWHDGAVKLAASRRPFLTAAWRNLAMLNYWVDPGLLLPLVPQGLQLDLYDGEALVTLVAFQFERARLFGIRVPWHQQFAEVNLRFYVRRVVAGQERLGVVFIKEMLPRRLVAWTARYVFGERFAHAPVSYRRNSGDDGLLDCECSWGRSAAAGSMSLAVDAGESAEPPCGLAAFVVDRSWAYTVGRAGHWREYNVTHRPWRVWAAVAARLSGNPSAWYGPDLGESLRRKPLSALLVDGSEVEVFRA